MKIWTILACGVSMEIVGESRQGGYFFCTCDTMPGWSMLVGPNQLEDAETDFMNTIEAMMEAERKNDTD